MRPRTSISGASADPEVIWNAIAAQLRACYDASRPLPANIDIFLQRLISQETDDEATNLSATLASSGEIILCFGDGKCTPNNNCWLLYANA